jgi:type 1 glutamine amidotransferase
LAAARGAASPDIARRLRSVLAELGFPPPSPRIKVAIITGGHEFDPVPFFAMFRSFEEVEFTHLPQADDSEAFEDIDGWPYDVIVFYNMTQNIPARRRVNLLRLLEDGVGVLALHHASGAYQPWPEFKKIIGCRYNVTASETGGEEHRPSSFRHDVDIPVRVADNSHSVSRGLADFVVHDETYKACEFESTNRVLLTTDEPSSDKPLCVVRNYRRANVCYIQLGHGPGIFSQEMFRKLVGQALYWCAEPKGQGGERREADRKTDQR